MMAQTKTFVKANSNLGMWQCFKVGMSDDAKGMRCFVWDFTIDGTTNNKGTMAGGLFVQKTLTNAVTTSLVDVSTTKADQPYAGSVAFKKTANWTEEYAFSAAADTYTNTKAATLADAARLAAAKVTTANAPLGATPTMAAAGWSTGFQWTFTFIYKPKADADDWYTNGKLFSGALYTFSQSSKNAYVGLKTCESATGSCAKPIEFN